MVKAIISREEVIQILKDFFGANDIMLNPNGSIMIELTSDRIKKKDNKEYVIPIIIPALICDTTRGGRTL